MTEKISQAEFLEAAAEGNVVMMRAFLMQNGQKEIDCVDEEGHTALMIAAQKGWFNVVRFLVENGCQLDLQNKEGKTAIMLAAWFGKNEVAKYLGDMRARVDIKDNYNETVYDLLDNRVLIDYLTHINSKDFEKEVSNYVDEQSGDVLYTMSKEQFIFLRQLVIPSVVIKAFEKMSYQQSMDLYKTAQQVMDKSVRQNVQNIIRNKRENDL